MTAYDDFEASVHDGDVVEVYDFARGATHWRYASTETRTFDGNVYTGVAIERSNVPLMSLGAGGSDFTVTMPTSLDVVQDHIGIPPDEALLLTIYRFHADDDTSYVEYWSGRVAEWRGNDRSMQARCISELDDPLDQLLPKIQDQIPCPHQFGDARCGIDREALAFVTAVNGTPDGRTVVVDSVDGEDDGWFRMGEIKHNASGNRRMIRTQVGTTLTLQSLFRDLADNDAVTLIPGCDRLATTCRDRYGNIARFGGCNTLRSGLNPFDPKYKRPFGPGGE